MRELFLPHCLDSGLRAADGTLLASPLEEAHARAAGFAAHPGFFARIFLAGECTSTFDLAWELLHREQLPEWSAVLALSQTGGRGQLRRVWVSPPGNLHVSFFLPPGMARLENMASLAAGFCIHAALQTMGIDTRLKWPNDLLLWEEGREQGKFGGLLLEERAGRLLAGLGLNLCSAPAAADMRQGRAVPPAALSRCEEPVFLFWRRLATALRQVWETSLADASPLEIRQQIEAVLAWKDIPVRTEEGGVRGMIAGLAADGSLQLRTDTGLVCISSGSIHPAVGAEEE